MNRRQFLLAGAAWAAWPRAAAGSDTTLSQLLERYAAERHLPGLAAIGVTQDGAQRMEAFGLADVSTGRAMGPNTRFYLGSVSKVLTSLLVLRLRDAGKLDLEAKAQRWVLGLDGRVRVHHLLSHSAGLPREGPGEYWFNGRFPETGALLKFAAQPLDFAPGSRARYSSVGYALLGHIASRVHGGSFAAALKHWVLAPLGMTDTRCEDGTADPRLAMGYAPQAGPLPSAQAPFHGLGAQPVVGRLPRNYHGARAMTPAFGIRSTMQDMGKLAAGLLGKGILSPASREDLRQVRAQGDGVGRSLGFRVTELEGRVCLRHDGWFAAHRCHLAWLMDGGEVWAAFGNADDARPAKLVNRILASKRW